MKRFHKFASRLIGEIRISLWHHTFVYHPGGPKEFGYVKHEYWPLIGVYVGLWIHHCKGFAFFVYF